MDETTKPVQAAPVPAPGHSAPEPTRRRLLKTAGA